MLTSKKLAEIYESDVPCVGNHSPLEMRDMIRYITLAKEYKDVECYSCFCLYMRSMTDSEVLLLYYSNKEVKEFLDYIETGY